MGREEEGDRVKREANNIGNRTKTQTPSLGSRPKGTRAREWCRARRRRRNKPAFPFPIHQLFRLGSSHSIFFCSRNGLRNGLRCVVHID
jgi:hypothetical protein